MPNDRFLSQVTWRSAGRYVLLFTSICCHPSVAQECITGPDAHQVSEYGTFTADASDGATIAENNATINNAVSTLGQAGGGTICIPEGTFYIGPDPTAADRALTIAYDNITIRGAGIDMTCLKTNGTWNTSAQRRGHGIIIEGTPNCATPRKNIVLRDFELDGQAGWTGDYCWTPPEDCGEDGWDISHKGIVPSWDACTDSVTIENVYVHHYRGEVLYCGGMGMGRLVVRNVRSENTNGSCFNLYAADLQVEHCTFGGPSRFWCELSARANQGGYPTNRAVFRNNTFENAVGATAIVMCQGDFQTYEFVFDSNTISDCPGAFGIYGGVGGPVTITNNTITNCGTVLEFGESPGWINSNVSANVTMEHNDISSSGCLVSFFATQENVTVRSNDFTGRSSTDLGQSTAAFYGAANLTSTLVEANTFRDCRTPEQTAGISGARPLFKDNVYENVERRHTQGVDWLSSSSPTATPHFEEHQIYTEEDNRIAVLENTIYAHGQVVALTGGSSDRRVRFAAGQSSYDVAQDRYLDGSTTLWFRYDTAQTAWMETTAPTTRIPIRPRKLVSSSAAQRLFDIRGRFVLDIVDLPDHVSQETIPGQFPRGNGIYIITDREGIAVTKVSGAR